MIGYTGYGFAVNRVFMGLELETDFSEKDIYHSKDKPSARTFSYNRDNSYGASARLGYVLTNGTLLYSRVGLVTSRFGVDYQINNLPESAISDERTLTGTRYGVGAEIPLTEQLYGRLETIHTNYESFYTSSADFNDHLNPSETQVNLGISWYFAPQKQPKFHLVKEDYSGFYSGVMLGYGTLSSQLAGQHQDGGSFPGSYGYDVTLGNQGFSSGLYAGYGILLGNFYLGAEIDATVSEVEWQRNRDTSGSGRSFKVQKRESYGLSGRFGYLFNNGTLVYLRAGLNRAKFNTEYVKGADSANYIDQNDYLDGPKCGVGFEIPMSAKSFVRFEYSYADYEKLHLLTSHTLPDDVTFASRENLFWIGFGFRF
jgi:opacity protein-like surface antigen